MCCVGFGKISVVVKHSGFKKCKLGAGDMRHPSVNIPEMAPTKGRLCTASFITVVSKIATQVGETQFSAGTR